MARSSSNDDSVAIESNSEKKSRKKKAKSVQDGKEDEVVDITEVKSKKSKRKKSEVPECTDNDDTPKKPKKSKREKLEETDEVSEELEEDKPTKSKKPSKRQLKREKKEAMEAEKRDASKVEAMSKALTYISTWKHAKSEWKFEKLKQIWLMDHLLDDTLVPEQVFPTVLEYFEGCKGMARATLLKKGMNVIKKYEEQQEASEETAESVEYNRARQLLQALPTEA